MTKIIKQYLFINYCGQKIGQFKNVDLYTPLLNVISGQVATIVFIPVAFLYIGLKGRNIWIFIFLFAIVLFFVRFFINNKSFINISFKELESQYEQISRKMRIVNFFIAIIITASSLILFGLSFYFLKYFV